MNNLTEQPIKQSNLESLEGSFNLTKKELENFKKLPKSQQEIQKQDKLAKLLELNEKLDKAIQEGLRTGNLDEAERLNTLIEIEKKDLIQQIEVTSINKILVHYSYTNPKTKKIEFKEKIELDIEQKLQEFIKFYKITNINLPPDFEKTIKDIWQRNQTEIQKAIEQNGFDEMLIIPANLSMKEVSEKMKMKNGYYYDDIKSGGTVQTLDGIPFTSPRTNKPRIVLVHKTPNLEDRPELKATLNIKGEDVKLDQALTLEEYIIFQRKYFKDTGKYLDEDDWTWTSTKSGARLVYSRWSPGGGKLDVDADALDFQDGNLGVRLSRSFF